MSAHGNQTTTPTTDQAANRPVHQALRVTTLSLLAAACSALVVTAGPATARPALTPAFARSAATCPQSGTVRGVSALISCGSARGTMRFGGTRLTLRNGQCITSSYNFNLDFGPVPQELIPKGVRWPDNFVLLARAHGHTASLQTSHDGKAYLGGTDEVKLKLATSQKSGTFSGVVRLAAGYTKVKVSGSFTC